MFLKFAERIHIRYKQRGKGEGGLSNNVWCTVSKWGAFMNRRKVIIDATRN